MILWPAGELIKPDMCAPSQPRPTVSHTRASEPKRLRATAIILEKYALWRWRWRASSGRRCNPTHLSIHGGRVLTGPDLAWAQKWRGRPPAKWGNQVEIWLVHMYMLDVGQHCSSSFSRWVEAIRMWVHALPNLKCGRAWVRGGARLSQCRDYSKVLRFTKIDGIEFTTYVGYTLSLRARPECIGVDKTR